MDNLKMYNFPRLKQEENMKRPITSNKFESVIKQQQQKNANKQKLRTRGFPGGPVAEPARTVRGPWVDFWSGNYIPHATTKDPSCRN